MHLTKSFFKFRTISVVSSTTPGMVENLEDAIDANGGHSCSGQGGEKDSPQAVPKCDAVSPLQWFNHKLAIVLC